MSLWPGGLKTGGGGGLNRDLTVFCQIVLKKGDPECWERGL